VTTRRLVLWRHGQTAWNLERRAQGQIDVPLDETGLKQAREVAPRLAALEPAFIWSSDLSRAQQTADELARVTGLSVRMDPRLREIHLGERQGLTVDEVRRRMPDVWAIVRSGEPPPTAPGGETEMEVGERAAAAMSDAAATLEPGQTGVLVAHGGSVRNGLWHFLGLPFGREHVLRGMSNCAWTVVEEGWGGQWRLVDYNAGTMPEPVLTDDITDSAEGD
jgi:glucosyl-3-phosphoglycerate phosphatase